MKTRGHTYAKHVGKRDRNKKRDGGGTPEASKENHNSVLT